jgi:hypothetical protein
VCSSDLVSRFEKLSARELKNLADSLGKSCPRDEVALYLKFMGAKDVDQALA